MRIQWAGSNSCSSARSEWRTSRRPRPVERARQSRRVVRLQQEVHRLDIERRHRCRRVRRDEHDERHAPHALGGLLAQLPRHVEPIAAGDPHIEQDDIRSLAACGPKRPGHILGFVGDLDVGVRRQQRPQPSSRERLVVHDEQPEPVRR